MRTAIRHNVLPSPLSAQSIKPDRCHKGAGTHRQSARSTAQSREKEFPMGRNVSLSIGALILILIVVALVF